MEARSWRHFDFWLIGATFALIGLGIAMIYSATFDAAVPSLNGLVFRHLVLLIPGTAILAFAAITDYRLFAQMGILQWILAVLALAIVLVLGRLEFGAQRWIDVFGFFQLQPSEPGKLLTIFALARFFSKYREHVHRLKVFLASIAIVAVPAGLTFLEPDLGTALVYGAIWAGIAFAAGCRLIYFGGIGVAALAILPFAWQALPTYMRDRFTIFLNPTSDPLNQGYNIIQASISVGSGGWFGRGYLSGTQSQLEFLRVRYADFIFSVLAEELGFVGAITLIALYAFLVIRAMRAALLTREPYGRLIVIGIISMLVFQVFVNIGMNMSMLPVTGIPLPFISYGGSSLITFMAAIGVIESITMRHRPLDF